MIELPGAPGDLVVLVAGNGGLALDATASPFEDALDLSLAPEASWAVGFLLRRDQFFGAALEDLPNARAWLETESPPSSLGACGRCMTSVDTPPMALLGGQACALPPFALASVHAIGGADVSLAETAARDAVVLGWAGRCPCEARAVSSASHLDIRPVFGPSDVHPFSVRIAADGSVFALGDAHAAVYRPDGRSQVRQLDPTPGRVFDVAPVLGSIVLTGAQLTDRETPAWLATLEPDLSVRVFEPMGLERLSVPHFLEVSETEALAYGRADGLPAAAVCTRTGDKVSCRLSRIPSEEPCFVSYSTRRAAFASLIGPREYAAISPDGDLAVGSLDSTDLHCVQVTPELGTLVSAPDPLVTTFATAERRLVACIREGEGFLLLTGRILSGPDRAELEVLGRSPRCLAFRDPATSTARLWTPDRVEIVGASGARTSTPTSVAYPELPSHLDTLDVHPSGWVVASNVRGEVFRRGPRHARFERIASEPGFSGIAADAPDGFLLVERTRLTFLDSGGTVTSSLAISLPEDPSTALLRDDGWILAGRSLVRLSSDGQVSELAKPELGPADFVRSMVQLDHRATLALTSEGRLFALEDEELTEVPSSPPVRWEAIAAADSIGWLGGPRRVGRVVRRLDGFAIEPEWFDLLAGRSFDEPIRIGPPEFEAARSFCADRVAFLTGEELTAAIGPTMTADVASWITEPGEDGRLELRPFSAFDGTARGFPSSIEQARAILGPESDPTFVFGGSAYSSATISRKGVQVSRLPFPFPTSWARHGRATLVTTKGRAAIVIEP
ncbi:MAG: hypothetical protein HYV07_23340 [Deltaproteobacteria bacterium]|nr:hypothetical protein [Deltaproteobacteria bacterium]